MLGLARVYGHPVAEFSVSDWRWNHLFICRAESAVHDQASVMAMAGFESDPIYRAAFSAVGDNPLSLADQHGLRDLREVLFGPTVDPDILRSNAEQIFTGLATALDAPTSVSSRPWGPILDEHFAQFTDPQFLLGGSARMLPVFEPDGALNLNAAFAIVEAAFPTEDPRVLALASRVADLCKTRTPSPDPTKETSPVRKPTIGERITDYVVDALHLGESAPTAEPPAAPAPEPPPAPVLQPVVAEPQSPDMSALIKDTIGQTLAAVQEQFVLTPRGAAGAEDPPATPPVSQPDPAPPAIPEPASAPAPVPAPEPAPAPEPTPLPTPPSPTLTADDVRRLVAEQLAVQQTEQQGSRQIPLLPPGAEDAPTSTELGERPAASLFSTPELTPCE
jgi:hypothetical protein